jgi:hypothetical protein
LVLFHHFRTLHISDIQGFCCRHSDPVFVKLEKIDILLALADEDNFAQILGELAVYGTNDNLEFARKSIQAVARLALFFPRFARKCVDVLIGFVRTKVQEIVEECIVVTVNLLRKYPSHFEVMIGLLFENLPEAVSGPRARAAQIWMVGEYSAEIEDADAVIDEFLERFVDDPVEVQMATITATMKHYLHDKQNGVEAVRNVLTLAANEVNNPDLNDRANLYWRLLSECPDRADFVVFDRSGPDMKADLLVMNKTLVDELIGNVGSVATVFGRFPDDIVPVIAPRITEGREWPGRRPGEDDEEEDEYDFSTQSYEGEEESSNLESSGGSEEYEYSSDDEVIKPKVQPAGKRGDLKRDAGSAPVRKPSPPKGGLGKSTRRAGPKRADDQQEDPFAVAHKKTGLARDDPFAVARDDGSDDEEISEASEKRLPLVLKELASNSMLQVRGRVRLDDGKKRVLELILRNGGSKPLEISSMALGHNYYGLFIDPLAAPIVIKSGKLRLVSSPVHAAKADFEASPRRTLVVNFRINRQKAVAVTMPLALEFILVPASEGGKLSREAFASHVQSIERDCVYVTSARVSGGGIGSVEKAKGELGRHRLFEVLRRGEIGYYSGKTNTGEVVSVELDFREDPDCEVTVRIAQPELGKVIGELVAEVLKA